MDSISVFLSLPAFYVVQRQKPISCHLYLMHPVGVLLEPTSRTISIVATTQTWDRVPFESMEIPRLSVVFNQFDTVILRCTSTSVIPSIHFVIISRVSSSLFLFFLLTYNRSMWVYSSFFWTGLHRFGASNSHQHHSFSWQCRWRHDNYCVWYSSLMVHLSRLQFQYYGGRMCV